MSANHEHRVCSYREAEAAIRKHEILYVNDCFCRGPARDGKAKWPYCGHPVRTCMGFRRMEDARYEVEEMSQARALWMREDWKKRGPMLRPARSAARASRCAPGRRGKSPGSAWCSTPKSATAARRASTFAPTTP